MRHYARLLAIAALAAGTAACDEKLSTLAGPTPNLEATFASVQANVLETTDSAGRPACINCHTTIGRPTPAGGLNLLHDFAYDQLVGKPSGQQPGVNYVTPGDPDGSYLVRKLEGRMGITGLRMPLNGPYLSQGQILILRRWIEQGASRN